MVNAHDPQRIITHGYRGTPDHPSKPPPQEHTSVNPHNPDRRTHIQILPLPPGEDYKRFYNHANVIPHATYRARSLTRTGSVEVHQGESMFFLPPRCYRWVEA